MKKKELVAKLVELGVEVPEKAKSDELKALLAKAVANPEPPPVSKGCRITASFKGVDEEGIKAVFPFTAEGKTLTEALKNLDFPAGRFVGIKVVVEREGKRAERMFAPNKWYAIYQGKNGEALERFLAFV